MRRFWILDFGFWIQKTGSLEQYSSDKHQYRNPVSRLTLRLTEPYWVKDNWYNLARAGGLCFYSRDFQSSGLLIQ
jgi:hypothetical protein